MSKTARIVSLVVLLLAILGINLSTAADMVVVYETESSCCPCYDKFQGCMNSGKTEAYCDGVWCQCMKDTYGTKNC